MMDLVVELAFARQEFIATDTAAEPFIGVQANASVSSNPDTVDHTADWTFAAVVAFHDDLATLFA